MKRILMIATGGTIASKPTDGGLSPQMSAEELLSAVPELSGICAIEAVQLMNIDSTNMNPERWLKIAAFCAAPSERFSIAPETMPTRRFCCWNFSAHRDATTRD